VINWLLKFADDTKLFKKVQSELDWACLQQNLQRLLDWSREWQMVFNVEKCKVMHIGCTNRNYRYHMDQKELEVVEEEKDLGMLITNDLKASQQCTAACNKANRVLGMMNRTIVYKSKKVLLNLYISLVPHMLNTVHQCDHLVIRKTKH